MISECLHYMRPHPQPPLFIFGCLSLRGVANEIPTHFCLITIELSITISAVELPKGKHFTFHTQLYQCNFLFSVMGFMLISIELPSPGVLDDILLSPALFTLMVVGIKLGIC